jgi:hypothetical protein
VGDTLLGGRIMKAYRIICPPLLITTFAMLAFAPSAAWSSACNEEVVVQIHFAPGALCWNYRGNATTFTGNFARGQNVEVQMSGEAESFDPQTNKVVTSWQPRSPSVSGPNKFFAEAAMNGALSFHTPASGTYRIGFSPCAMWGGQGQVSICTK